MESSGGFGTREATRGTGEGAASAAVKILGLKRLGRKAEAYGFY